MPGIKSALSYYNRIMANSPDGKAKTAPRLSFSDSSRLREVTPMLQYWSLWYIIETSVFRYILRGMKSCRAWFIVRIFGGERDDYAEAAA